VSDPEGTTPVVAPGSSGDLSRLALLVVAVLALVALTHGWYVLLVVVALVAMVMAHEAGHFLTAKLCGMKVTEYFFGFGPKLFSFRRGETEYGVKAIPAGGYVRIVGMTTLEEIHPDDEARSFRQASFPRRVLVASAGSAVHFVIAFALLFSMVAFAGMPSDEAEIGGFTTFVHATSPAKAAGLQSGDVVESIDHKALSGIDSLVSTVRRDANRSIELGVRRGSRSLEIAVRVADARSLSVTRDHKVVPDAPASGPAVGVIGVELTARYATRPLLQSVPHAAALLGTLTRGSLDGLGGLFSTSFLRSFVHSVTTAASARGSSGSATAGNSGTQLVSILGAIQISSEAARENVTELLGILASVNVFIALVNLLPMLPLDGGHVAIACYERLRSRRGRRYHADVAKLMPVAYVFLAFMVVLGLGALYANALNPVHLPGG
jgi:membrane-associated protease RseP (regulator of RpoE activity)